MPVNCTCVGCGRVFSVAPSNAHRKWCSAACRYRTPGWSRALYPNGRKTCVCQACGAHFEVVRSLVGRYCSRKCLGIANGHRQTAGRDPSRYPLFTCAQCGKAYPRHISLTGRTRFCSHSCRATWNDLRRRIARPTSIERLLEAALRAAGVPAEREHRVGRFSVDFALPARRIAIEADGAYWHSLPKQQRADARKDAYLTSAGWRVLRFSEARILLDAAACAAEVAALR